MKKFAVLMLALVIVIGIGACSKSQPEPEQEPVTPAPEAPAPEEAPAATAPAPEAPADMAPATAAPAADANDQTVTASSFVGTKWQFDQVVLDVKDETTIKVSGGPVDKLAPNGLDVKYTLKDGTFSAMFMGKPVPGTFDGTTLVIDGKPTVRMQ